jgi:hypothetical protein
MLNSKPIFNRQRSGLGAPNFVFFAMMQAVVAAVHAYFLCDPIDHVYSDMGGYVNRAWQISIGQSLRPSYFFYPPGTSYFFAIFLSTLGFELGLSAIKLMQIVLLALSTGLIGLISWRCYRTTWLSNLLMGFTVMYLPFSAQASFFMAEALFCFLLLFAIYLVARPSNEVPFFLLGLLLGILTLIKGQALALLFSLLLIFTLQKIGRKSLGVLVFGIALPLASHWSITTNVSGDRSFYIGANDSFNTYLGQSRHKALGALDKNNNSYYVFHNNNAGLGYRFKTAKVLFRSIDDRRAFRSDVIALWRDAPLQQLLISLQNVVELFSINPRWPQRNNQFLSQIDLTSQWLFLFLITIPALYVLLSRRKIKMAYLGLFGLPLLFLAGLCGLTMGQPRYLVPFQYLIILLAGPFYLELKDRLVNIIEGDA